MPSGIRIKGKSKMMPNSLKQARKMRNAPKKQINKIKRQLLAPKRQAKKLYRRALNQAMRGIVWPSL